MASTIIHNLTTANVMGVLRKAKALEIEGVVLTCRDYIFDHHHAIVKEKEKGGGACCFDNNVEDRDELLSALQRSKAYSLKPTATIQLFSQLPFTVVGVEGRPIMVEFNLHEDRRYILGRDVASEDTFTMMDKNTTKVSLSIPSTTTFISPTQVGRQAGIGQ